MRTILRPMYAGQLWAGSAIALYVLAGRWGPARGGGLDYGYLTPLIELRYWITVVLAATALLLPVKRSMSKGQVTTKLSMLLIAFFGYLVVSSFWAPDLDRALIKAIDVILMATASLSIVRILRNDYRGEVMKAFWLTVLGVGALLAVLAIGVMKGNPDGQRLAVLGGGPNIFGRIMGLFALACLYFWRTRGYPLLFLPLVSIAILLVLLSGSRGSLVALGVSVCTFAAAAMRRPTRLLASFIVVAGSCWIAMTATQMGEAALKAYDERIERLTIEEQYTSNRAALYDSALDLALSTPIAGAGLDAFHSLGLGVYPHNIFLELFCEAGVLGVGLFVAFLLFAICRIAARRHVVLDAASVSGFVLIFVASQFSGDLYDSRAIFVFLAAALLAYDRSVSSKHLASVMRVGKRVARAEGSTA